MDQKIPAANSGVANRFPIASVEVIATNISQMLRCSGQRFSQP